MTVDLLPFWIGQRAPAGEVLTSQWFQEVWVLLQQMLNVQPIDFHDALEYFRGMDSGAVGQERISPHAGPAHIDCVQSVNLPPLRLEIETSGAFPLDPNRLQGKVIG